MISAERTAQLVTMENEQMELHPDKPIQAKWLSPIAQILDAFPLWEKLVGLELSPGDYILRVHGSVPHLRRAWTIEIQEAEVSLRL
jgi:hypothetical protein